jgi:hypothetical protein
LKLAAVLALPSERFLSNNTSYRLVLAAVETPLTMQASMDLRTLARHHYLSKELHIECRSIRGLSAYVLANRSTNVSLLLKAFAKKLHPEAVFEDLRLLSNGCVVQPHAGEMLFERDIQDGDELRVMLVRT